MSVPFVSGTFFDKLCLIVYLYKVNIWLLCLSLKIFVVIDANETVLAGTFENRVYYYLHCCSFDAIDSNLLHLIYTC